MANVKFILTQGIGFSPGSIKYIPTLGFSAGAAVAVLWTIDTDTGDTTAWAVDTDTGDTTAWAIDTDTGDPTAWTIDTDTGQT